jgi:integrator complex subunit 1
MPWLADLVESNEGAWSLLPVQCLCEFLLHQAAEEISAAQLSGADAMDDSGNKLTKRKERRHKQQQLIQHLGLLLKDPNQTPDSCREVLDYLMRRLGAQQALARQQAAAVIFSCSILLILCISQCVSDN